MKSVVIAYRQKRRRSLTTVTKRRFNYEREGKRWKRSRNSMWRIADMCHLDWLGPLLLTCDLSWTHAGWKQPLKWTRLLLSSGRVRELLDYTLEYNRGCLPELPKKLLSSATVMPFPNFGYATLNRVKMKIWLVILRSEELHNTVSVDKTISMRDGTACSTHGVNSTRTKISLGKLRYGMKWRVILKYILKTWHMEVLTGMNG